MRTRAAGSAVVIIAGAALAACFSFGDLSGGDSTTDGGSDGTASSDSAPSDSGVTSDVYVDSGPPRYCATVVPPDGGDFFCADFDGTNFAEGFTDAAVTDAATLGATSLVSVSAPNALVATAQSLSDVELGYLFWQKTGSTQIQEVTLSAEVNPVNETGISPTMGGLEVLLEIQLDNGDVQWGYTHGAATQDAGSYTGYFVRILGTGGAVFQYTYGVDYLAPETWTNVSLSFDLGSGATTVTYGGSVAGTAGIGLGTSTSLGGVVGCNTLGNTIGGSWRFDNFQITSRRAP